MSRISIPGFIHAKPASDWDTAVDVVDGHRLTFFSIEDLSCSGYVNVCPYLMEFDLPEGWDPRAQQIDALVTKQAQLRRVFAKEMMDIETALSHLRAIEHTA